MKTCLIRQPAGAGDILFGQKIAKLLLSTDRVTNVIWPVVDQYNYFEKYIGHPNINFVNENDDFPHKQIYNSDTCKLYEDDELLYIPLQYADRSILSNPTTGNHPMYVKYELCNNLDYSDWYDFVDVSRDTKREQKLIEHLEIDLDEPYILVNKFFGTPPNSLQVQHIQEKFDSKVIEMVDVGFDNLFDWIGVLENAKAVHTVETALCYIAALINKQNMHIYSRNTHTDFKYIKNVFPTNWSYYSL
jgi:hypothetical protein